MSAYTKNIAVIKTLKSGFSTDGGPLSGIIRVEKYGQDLKVETSYINFAPLSEGKYVCAISDGNNVCVLEGDRFEGQSALDTAQGFFALICFVGSEVLPIACALCGDTASDVEKIKKEIERQEIVNVEVKKTPYAYEDEAVAEENYYEFDKPDKDGGTVCQTEKKEECAPHPVEDETDIRAVEKEELAGGLAHEGMFYDRVKGEVENVLSSYPKEDALCEMVENSKWVKIDYNEGKFYVFGVIYAGGSPQYLCYGVPSADSKTPPQSLAGRASFIPCSRVGDKGYWVMYQDAATGASIAIEAE